MGKTNLPSHHKYILQGSSVYDHYNTPRSLKDNSHMCQKGVCNKYFLLGIDTFCQD